MAMVGNTRPGWRDMVRQGGANRYEPRFRSRGARRDRDRPGRPGRPGVPELQFDASLERGLSEIQRQGDEAGIRAGEARETLFNRTFDPNSPFSQQALLDRQLKVSAAQAALGFGKVRGGLYQGAYEGVSNDLAFEGQQKQDALLSGYRDSLDEINRGELDTKGQLSRAADDAIWEAAIAQAADLEGTQANYGRRRRKGNRGRGHNPGGRR